MRNFKFVKTAFLLFVLAAFSNCEDNGPIQSEVKTNTSTSINIKDVQGKSSYKVEDTVDISDLLDIANNFLEAKIEQIALKLEDYSGTSIEGTITVKLGSTTIFNEKSITLTSDNTILTVSSALRDILTLVNSGEFKIFIEGTTSKPIEDNDFKLIVTPQIKATVAN